ncbi:hypothetical protein B0H17DRAFT_1211616 [Mycena rosella]|uniref:Uncharacterized protein n=1 Tax=Mycena rosella TaxID=1033263 RepID=A0AAD7CUL8_MYCRO|nr:hypothetical protein B0H17DRAFT_1211616 [Mycena rosella]
MATPGADAAAATLISLSGASAPSSGPVPPPSAAKRAFEEIVETFGIIPAKKSKKARRDTMDTKSALDKLTSMAKYFVRAVHPFMDIGCALHHGTQALWGAPVVSCPSNSIVIPAAQLEEQQRFIDAFSKMMAISPDSLEVLREFYKDKKEWPRIVKHFRAQAASARQQDTNNLKQKTHYVPDDPTKPLTPAVSESTSKSDRSINHPMLRNSIVSWPLRLKINARMPPANGEDQVAAVPGAAVPERELTPDALKHLTALMTGKLTNGKPALTAGKYPSCFYPEGTYDPADPEKGLFRSAFLLRVLRNIWTTPSSAMGGADRLKAISNARAHGKFSIDGRMIGYGCTQARTMLSTSDWTPKDGTYDYEKLFNQVVKLFEDDPADPWVIETLQWYQDGVFGKISSGGADDDDNEEDDSDSESSSICAHRAARRQTPIATAQLTNLKNSYNRRAPLAINSSASLITFLWVSVPHCIKHPFLQVFLRQMTSLRISVTVIMSLSHIKSVAHCTTPALSLY